ncbi:hypothetical protein NQ317_007219 [Molorchus minor]|uniref:Uncharacterized protein n=1 Tax=Molorchus minor TaxID=1323400 RepID=A0ABQ9IQS8_9CUCU|nr:hypothetical protein NQ317_007219 [Molorchus minor]
MILKKNPLQNGSIGMLWNRELGGRTGSTTSVRSDLTVAKRMALLVFTDFACWAPSPFSASPPSSATLSSPSPKPRYF